MKEQYPNLGSVVYLVVATCLPGKKGNSGSRILGEKFIYHLIDREKNGSLTNQETIFKALKELKDISVENGRTKIAITHDSTDPHTLRKMIEILFINTDIEITIHSDKYKKDDKKPPGYETVLIDTGTKTFAETLKTLKKEINIDKEGYTVSGVRSSRNGHVLVDIKGDTSKATSFSRLMNSKISGAKALSGPSRSINKVLHLKHLEGDATLEEIKEAVVAALPETTTDVITVKALRPAFAGRQNATLILPTEIAERLLDKRSLRVGWGFCRVVEREEVTQCFRCREFGHITRNCQGPDRSKLCRRCGAEGHNVIQCSNPEKCMVCSTEGHRDGSLKCHAYRRALELRRRATNRDRDLDNGKNNKERYTGNVIQTGQVQQTVQVQQIEQTQQTGQTQ